MLLSEMTGARAPIYPGEMTTFGVIRQFCYLNKDPTVMTRAVARMIHEGATVEEAMKELPEEKH